MRIGYADPPYPGMYKRYGEQSDSDYPMIIQKLVTEYDAWILCAGATDLRKILPMFDPFPYRVAAWVKPFAFGRPNVNPIWSWEPVFFYSQRKGRQIPVVKDHLVCNAKGASGKSKYFFGAKPQEFNHWILDIVGWRQGDTVDDLFPGTKGMAAAIRERLKVTLPLDLVGE